MGGGDLNHRNGKRQTHVKIQKNRCLQIWPKDTVIVIFTNLEFSPFLIDDLY